MEEEHKRKNKDMNNSGLTSSVNISKSEDKTFSKKPINKFQVAMTNVDTVSKTTETVTESTTDIDNSIHVEKDSVTESTTDIDNSIHVEKDSEDLNIKSIKKIQKPFVSRSENIRSIRKDPEDIKIKSIKKIQKPRVSRGENIKSTTLPKGKSASGIPNIILIGLIIFFIIYFWKKKI